MLISMWLQSVLMPRGRGESNLVGLFHWWSLRINDYQEVLNVEVTPFEKVEELKVGDGSTRVW